MVGRLTDFFMSRDAEEANLGYIKGNDQAENFWKKLGFKTVRVTANTPIEHLERRTRAKPQP